MTKIFQIEASIRKQISDKVAAEDITTACDVFKTAYPDAEIHFINDKIVVGFDEDSGHPIFFDDDYSEDEFGIMWLNNK